MSDIATYLTIDGQTYIAPQVDIAFRDGRGGSCPDYVALDFRRRHVVVVEETEASNTAILKQRIKERASRWFIPLSIFLLKNQIVFEDWGMRILGIVRSDCMKRFEKGFDSEGDVSFVSIEDCTFPWNYWDKRRESGLPGGETYVGHTVGEWASSKPIA
ncbi:MAG: hypothetical protein ABF812_13950 [Gluconobacter cerinus]|uniref:hypothetical protein n=1 Tax=Gluconobacter TaxID=441 RepID=UPI0039E76A4A